MKAKRPFWLDGGYDRDAVESCPYHPEHQWWVFRLGDVIESDGLHGNEDEFMVICRACYVPRCGHTGDSDPCTLPRHHREPHHYALSNRREPVGA